MLARGFASAIVISLIVSACSTGDDGDAGGGDAPADTAPATTDTTSSTTTSTSTTTTTTIPGPLLAEVLAAVEVSARFLPGNGDAERVLAVAADTSLAELPVPDDVDRAPIWCSGVAASDSPAGGAVDGFVVRVGAPGVDRSEGGLEGFELVSAELDPDAPEPGPASATVRLDLEGESLATVDAVVTLADEPSTGTFRGEFVGGDVIEGAFRCE